MIRRPPRSTRTDTLVPYTTRFRSGGFAGLSYVPMEKWSGLPVTLLLASLAVVGAFPLAILFAFGRRSTRSEEHTSELQSLMRISYAVFCLQKKTLPSVQPYITN